MAGGSKPICGIKPAAHAETGYSFVRRAACGLRPRIEASPFPDVRYSPAEACPGPWFAANSFVRAESGEMSAASFLRPVSLQVQGWPQEFRSGTENG